jgi:hypothetical protein
MILSAYFADGGTPKTGLSPVIDVYDLDATAHVVAAAAMIEVGGGFYSYTFAAYDPEIHYSFICDGGAALFGAQRYSIGSIDPDPMFTSNVEGAVTVQEALAVILAFAAGKATGGGTASVKYRNQADTVNRLTQTVDASGNRSATALDTSDL